MMNPKLAIACGLITSMLQGAPVGLTERVRDHRASERLRVVVFGDGGTGGQAQADVARGMVQACADHGGCDFALMLGDNIYPSGVRSATDKKFQSHFERPYAGFGRMDMWLVPGNHDERARGSIDSEVAYTQRSERWRMPAPDYEIPLLPDWIRIYGLATTSLEDDQGLEQLSRARAALGGGERWRILFGHHPIYSSGTHADRYGRNRQMKGSLEPLIMNREVHLYLSGHEHHQEHLRAARFDQIVQGAAAKLRTPHRIRMRGDEVTPILGAAERYGFALLELTSQTMKIQFFGCDGPTCTPFHCQTYERDEFFGPGARSLPCPVDAH